MSWLDEVGDVLQRYGGPPQPQQTNVSSDFAKVAAHAPSASLADGLATAFRSPSTPPFSEMISNLFQRSDPQQRAGILNHLIAAAGPTASGIIGKLAGGFSGTAAQTQTSAGRPTITAQQAQQVQPATVGELASHAEKSDPSIVDRAGEFYAQHPKLVQGLGAAALALIMSHVSKQHH
jgi:hypothetical protein